METRTYHCLGPAAVGLVLPALLVGLGKTFETADVVGAGSDVLLPAETVLLVVVLTGICANCGKTV